MDIFCALSGHVHLGRPKTIKIPFLAISIFGASRGTRNIQNWPRKWPAQAMAGPVIAQAGVNGALYPRCPLRGPKNRNGQKWYFDGFGPSQLTCPKSGQKVPKKWSANGLSKIWGQKNAKKVPRKLSKNAFWANRGGGLRPPPKKERGGLQPARPFLVLYLPKNIFLATFLLLFCHFFAPRSC